MAQPRRWRHADCIEISSKETSADDSTPRSIQRSQTISKDQSCVLSNNSNHSVKSTKVNQLKLTHDLKLTHQLRLLFDLKLTYYVHCCHVRNRQFIYLHLTSMLGSIFVMTCHLLICFYDVYVYYHLSAISFLTRIDIFSHSLHFSLTSR